MVLAHWPGIAPNVTSSSMPRLSLSVGQDEGSLSTLIPVR
jgi:hypothetical protein